MPFLNISTADLDKAAAAVMGRTTGGNASTVVESLDAAATLGAWQDSGPVSIRKDKFVTDVATTIVAESVFRESITDYLGASVMKAGANMVVAFTDGTDDITYSLSQNISVSTLEVTGVSTLQDVLPGAAGVYDIGALANRFATAYVEGIDVDGNIAVSGTVDGVDLAALNTAYLAHAASTLNPHAVTKAQVGLGSVENTALSTWAGSMSITTLGLIGQGEWRGTVIDSQYIDQTLSVETVTASGHASFLSAAFAGINTTTLVKGDSLFATGANAIARFGLGTNGQFLTVDTSTSTGVKWSSIPGGSTTFDGLLDVNLTGTQVANSTLRWDGTHWVDNGSFRIDASGDVVAGTWGGNALGATSSPTFAGLTVSGAASLGAQIAWDDGETRKGSVNLDAIDSTTWVTAIAGFGGQAGALIAGRMAGGVTTVILAQEGTTGISTGHEVSDGTALQFQVVGTDLQVRAAATGSESATVNVSAIKLG